ncbi:MarR family winged helix-turn-helix transcriptional regulator [Nakamurella alba]|nr:MarR family transcriptional regulator [Nakamurella alba]
MTETVGPVAQSVGYVLKQVASRLRAAMDEVLRPLDLTVSQYVCLELLKQQPGMSNADLARAAFVTRQSMNLVLRGLQDRGLLSRPEVAETGRALPTELTPAGGRALAAASAAVRGVEKRMLGPLSGPEQQRLLGDLTRCAQALV